jgi:hypothetical protein
MIIKDKRILIWKQYNWLLLWAISLSKRKRFFFLTEVKMKAFWGITVDFTLAFICSHFIVPVLSKCKFDDEDIFKNYSTEIIFQKGDFPV